MAWWFTKRYCPNVCPNSTHILPFARICQNLAHISPKFCPNYIIHWQTFFEGAQCSPCHSPPPPPRLIHQHDIFKSWSMQGLMVFWNGGGGEGGLVHSLFACMPKIVYLLTQYWGSWAPTTSHIRQNVSTHTQKKVLPQSLPKFYQNFAHISPKFCPT